MRSTPARIACLCVVLLGGFLARPLALSAQDVVRSIPSGPTPPAGTTNYDVAKAIADALVKGLSLLEDYAIDRAWNQWLKENQPEIARVMPANGGVLVRVQIAQQTNPGEDMPQHRYFLSAFIADSGNTQAEAEAKYERENSRVLQGAPRGYAVSGEWRWIATPSKNSPTPGAGGSKGDRLGVERLVSQLDAEVQSERARLDLDWEIVQRLNQEVNALRLEVGPEPSGGDPDPQERAKAAFEREKQRIRQWKDAELRAINAEQIAATQESLAIQASQQALAMYIANWRCPAGLTLEVCELPQNQNAARDVHLAERRATRAYRAQQEAAIASRSQLIANRRARLSARTGALSRQGGVLESNARAALDQSRQQRRKTEGRAKELKEKEEESQKRMERFKKDDAQQARLEQLLKEAWRILATIPG
jgi:hypothetical protein